MPVNLRGQIMLRFAVQGMSWEISEMRANELVGRLSVTKPDRPRDDQLPADTDVSHLCFSHSGWVVRCNSFA